MLQHVGAEREAQWAASVRGKARMAGRSPRPFDVTIGTMTISDITAKITFLPEGRSVRAGPIVGRSLGCALVIDGALYDVRFNLKPGKTIALGSTAVLDGMFPDLDAVLERLLVGKTFTLWDRGAIGHGIVLKIRGDA